ncbi:MULTISPECIES: nuclease-related domain-containing protein [Clostridium]|uniref:nuclease-related domain-containing protein n=1 Tax=Clostridium TaxID=1485 RepID=UPI002152501D|nr:nuclease-related domain-containing protein [Clostridium sp. LY3-2]MCR6515206.1 NERD domain-containing protein [Clostridium sp. LY3-2]
MALLVTKENIKKGRDFNNFDFNSFKNIIVFLIVLAIIYFLIEVTGVKYHFGTHSDIIILVLALVGSYMYIKYAYIRDVKKLRDIKKIQKDIGNSNLINALSDLNDSFYILKNVSFKGKRRIINISLAVLFEEGIVFINEEKYKGEVQGDILKEKWKHISNNKKREIDNLFKLKDRKGEELNYILKENNHKINIYSILLFDEDTKISIAENKNNRAFNNYKYLIDWILSLKKLEKNKIKFDEVIEIIEELV